MQRGAVARLPRGLVHMKTRQVLSPGAQVAIAAIVLLGMVGGFLIVAHSGQAHAVAPGSHGTLVIIDP